MWQVSSRLCNDKHICWKHSVYHNMTLRLSLTLCSNCHLHSWTVFTRKIVNSEPKLTKIIQMHWCVWDKTSSLLWVSLLRKALPVIIAPIRRKTQRKMFPASVPKWSMIFPWQMVNIIPNTCAEHRESKQVFACTYTHTHTQTSSQLQDKKAEQMGSPSSLSSL